MRLVRTVGIFLMHSRKLTRGHFLVELAERAVHSNDFLTDEDVVSALQATLRTMRENSPRSSSYDRMKHPAVRPLVARLLELMRVPGDPASGESAVKWCQNFVLSQRRG